MSEAVAKALAEPAQDVGASPDELKAALAAMKATQERLEAQLAAISQGSVAPPVAQPGVPVFNPKRHANRCFGECRAYWLQDGMYFDKAGNYLTWKQAIERSDAELSAMDAGDRAEALERQAGERMARAQQEADRKQANARIVQVGNVRVEGVTTIGKEAPVIEDYSVAELEDLLEEKRAAVGAKTEGAEEEADITDVNAAIAAMRPKEYPTIDNPKPAETGEIKGTRKEQLMGMDAKKVANMAKALIESASNPTAEALAEFEEYPKTGRGSKEKNADFIIRYTGA